MNILLLTNHLNIGGLTTYTNCLANELEKKGHSIFIGSSGGQTSGNLGSVRYSDLGISTKCEFGPKVLRALKQSVSLIKSEKIDLIHAQTRVTAVLASLAGKMTNIPFVTTAHGFYQPRIGRKLFPCWGELTIAISKPVYDHLAHDFHLNESKLRLIYNGTDVKRFSTPVSEEKIMAFKKEHGIYDNLPIIGTVSRLSPVKGHEYLLEAFYKLLKKRKALLLLVGDGPKAADFKRVIKEFNIERYVRMIPSMDEPEIALSVMDIFILPSLQEGLSLSILEAQASGLPVIATNVGGISQIIINGKTGFLVPSKDVEGLERNMEKILLNPERASAIAKAGYERVHTKFNMDNMINQVEQVYQETIKTYKSKLVKKT